MSDTAPLKKSQSLLLIAAVVSLALWMIPALRPLLIPLIYFNTPLHELFHALAGIATGGSVGYIHVYADGSGVAQIQGGNLVLVASAGYLGTAVAGGLMIAQSRAADRAKKSLWITAAAMAGSLILFVRGDLVGVISGLLWSVALIFVIPRLKADHLIFAGKFLGLQLCVTSLHAFFALMAITTSSSATTDAMILQQATGIPALLWASLWAILAVFSVFGSLKLAWNGASGPRS